jgi:hypothetical protein
MTVDADVTVVAMSHELAQFNARVVKLEQLTPTSS